MPKKKPMTNFLEAIWQDRKVRSPCHWNIWAHGVQGYGEGNGLSYRRGKLTFPAIDTRALRKRLRLP